MSDQTSALRSGLISAATTGSVLVLAIYLSPDGWKLLVAHVVTAVVIAFWVAFTTRLTGADVLSELGINYPDLRPEASLHGELAALRTAIEELQRKVS